MLARSRVLLRCNMSNVPQMRPQTNVSVKTALTVSAAITLSLLVLNLPGVVSRKESSAQRASSLTQEAKALTLEGYGPLAAGSNGTEAFAKVNRC